MHHKKGTPEEKTAGESDKILEKSATLVDKIEAFIRTNLRPNLADDMFADSQAWLPKNRPGIHKYLKQLTDNFLSQDPPHEVYALLIIVQENLHRFIQKGGVLTDDNIHNIIAVNFILAHKAHSEIPLVQEDCSTIVFKLNHKKEGIVPENWLGTLERRFLRSIHHELYIGNALPSAPDDYENITGISHSKTMETPLHEHKATPTTDIALLDKYLNEIKTELQHNPAKPGLWTSKTADAFFLDKVIKEYKQDGPISFAEHLSNKVREPGYKFCSVKTKELVENMLPKGVKESLKKTTLKKS